MSDSKLVLFGRSFRALLLREIATRFSRNAGGYVWAILEPVSYVLIMTMVFSLLVHAPPLGGSFALFFASGYVAFSFYKDIANYAGSALAFNKPLFSFSQIEPFDAILARVYLQFLTTFVSAVLVLSFCVVSSKSYININLFYLFLSIVSAVVAGWSMAMISSVMTMVSSLWDRIYGIINRPLFIISGIFFLPEGLPKYIQDVLWYNPVLHIICAFRMAIYSEYNSQIFSLTYLLSWVLILAFLGFFMIAHYRFEVHE